MGRLFITSSLHCQSLATKKRSTLQFYFCFGARAFQHQHPPRVKWISRFPLVNPTNKPKPVVPPNGNVPLLRPSSVQNQRSRTGPSAAAYMIPCDERALPLAYRSWPSCVPSPPTACQPTSVRTHTAHGTAAAAALFPESHAPAYLWVACVGNPLLTPAAPPRTTAVSSLKDRGVLCHGGNSHAYINERLPASQNRARRRLRLAR